MLCFEKERKQLLEQLRNPFDFDFFFFEKRRDLMFLLFGVLFLVIVPIAFYFMRTKLRRERKRVAEREAFESVHAQPKRKLLYQR